MFVVAVAVVAALVLLPAVATHGRFLRCSRSVAAFAVACAIRGPLLCSRSLALFAVACAVRGRLLCSRSLALVGQKNRGQREEGRWQGTAIDKQISMSDAHARYTCQM